MFSTTDSALAIDHLQSAYGTGFRVTGAQDGGLFWHHRAAGDSLALDDLRLPLRASAHEDPFNSLVITTLRAGRFERECAGIHESFRPGDIYLNAEPRLPLTARVFDIEVRNVVLDLAALAQVATISPTSATLAPGPIRFTGFQPISDNAATNWKRTTSYLAELVANTEALAQPLIQGTAARMLAATALATFPNTALTEPTAQDRRDATSATVRRAVAFIEQHSDRDLSVADIAAAAHVSIRAVQVAFRRVLDATPMQYLRQVRLEQVHRELQAANPNDGATVTDIATSWGFYNYSRFAARYRQAYGVTPRATLRGG